MTLKENISQMLDSIAAKDFDSASELFNTVVADKVGAALENLKVDVANRHFNGVKESVETLDEISQKLATRAYGKRTNQAYEMGDSFTDDESRKAADRESDKSDKMFDRIGRKWGKKGQEKANKQANAEIFGGKKPYKEEVEELDEISREKAIAASAERDNRTFEIDDYNDGSPGMKRDLDRSSNQGEKNANYIAKRWGKKGISDANKAANKRIFGE